MNKIATITSKRQLTIPADIFRKVKMKDGQKVIITEKDGLITISKVNDLVDKLAGSLDTPKKWQNKSGEEIVQTAKEEYFKEGH